MVMRFDLLRKSLLTFWALAGLTQAAEIIPNRYIVELAGAPAAETQAALLRGGARRQSLDRLASNPQVVARRQAIRRQQAAMATSISRRGGSVVESMDTVLNAIVITGDARLAEAIRSMPGVVRVKADVRVQAKMDRGLTLASFPEAVNRVGLEKAGAGIKIAILDSGIDASHPGFRDDSLTPPEGFPRVSSDANTAYITKKVIVARSYEDLAGDAGYGSDARDVNGHGTNAACSAACILHETPIGAIAGSAPKAFLGSYKVLGDNGGGSESAILKGIDDAVKDGFDVLNLSLGNELTDDPAGDLQVRAVNAASDAGAIVLAAAGNEGSEGNENSINTPGLADKIITVGSSSSDRSLDEQGSQGPIDPNRISDFSSRGPSLAGTIKPDMLAVGDNLYVAASSLSKGGKLYTVTQGTSFATPTVAGAAAFLKAARPGLTAAQYRSLLVNSSTNLQSAATGKPLLIRHQGAGRLNMLASLEAPVAVEPVSLNFGRGADSADLVREITITNVTASGVTLKFSVQGFDDKLAPALGDVPTVLGPSESAKISVRFSGAGLSGEYQGFILIANESNSVVARVPYAYSVPAPVPASITLFKIPESGESGGLVTFFGRVLDASGVEIASPNLEVVALSGGGKLEAMEMMYAKTGLFGVQLRLGSPGENVFQFKAASAVRTVTIVAK
jgi:hypothetical protein